jgi:8-oxo-dGTP pyrophosphatase MutT (NUDIX family)
VSAPHRVWTGERWIELPVPVSGGEPVVVPNINAIVYDSLRRHVLLQRRDKPGEAVRGRWEVPGGRWRAGEPPDVAIAREVLEETGLRLTAVAAAVETHQHEPHVATVAARPVSVVVGTDGAYPSLHVVFECQAEGTPVALPEETADPRWWPVDELREVLETSPEQFVWQTVGILRSVLG